MIRHRRLHRQLVNRVNHEIKTRRKQFGQILFVHKILDFVHPAFRLNLHNPFVQRSYFRLAEIGRERVQLAVHIGNGDIVQINQRQFAHAAAGQGFHRPRAHAAHAHHAHMRLTQSLQALFAV